MKLEHFVLYFLVKLTCIVCLIGYLSLLWAFQTLIMGNRDGIDEMSSTNASVLLSVLKLIDRYDLYGQVAYPKHHRQSEVPDIYRLAAKTKVTLSGLE